jgi:hypothetical protein
MRRYEKPQNGAYRYGHWHGTASKSTGRVRVSTVTSESESGYETSSPSGSGWSRYVLTDLQVQVRYRRFASGHGIRYRPYTVTDIIGYFASISKLGKVPDAAGHGTVTRHGMYQAALPVYYLHGTSTRWYTGKVVQGGTRWYKMVHDSKSTGSGHGIIS